MSAMLSILLSIPLSFLVGSAPAPGPSVDEPRAAPAAPVLRFEANEVEYGTLLQGEVSEKEVVIHNDGTAPLLLTKATPSCGCTTMIDFAQRIPPGGRGSVTFLIDSKRIKPGDSRKRIRFDTNDPRQPTADYYFTTDVLKLYRSEPAEIRVEGLFDEEKTATVRLIGTTEHGFELLGVRSRGEKFTVDDFLELGEGRYELVLKVGAVAMPEDLRDPLDLLIQVKDGRQIEVGQWVDIAHWDPVLVAPAVAVQFLNRDTDMLLREGAKPQVKTVTLRSRDPRRSFQVLSVRTEGLPEGVFTTEVVPVIEGSHYNVKVVLPEYRAEAFLMGKLIIETDAEVQPVRILNLRAKFGRRP